MKHDDDEKMSEGDATNFEHFRPPVSPRNFRTILAEKAWLRDNSASIDV